MISLRVADAGWAGAGPFFAVACTVFSALFLAARFSPSALVVFCTTRFNVGISIQFRHCFLLPSSAIQIKK